MENVMKELQPVIINGAVVILTTITSYIGIKIKSFIEEKINSEIKKKVVETTCQYINQLYSELDGSEKFQKAKENIIQQLNEKGISISELELDILIESTVNSLKKSIQ